MGLYIFCVNCSLAQHFLLNFISKRFVINVAKITMLFHMKIITFNGFY